MTNEPIRARMEPHVSLSLALALTLSAVERGVTKYPDRATNVGPDFAEPGSHERRVLLRKVDALVEFALYFGDGDALRAAQAFRSDVFRAIDGGAA